MSTLAIKAVDKSIAYTASLDPLCGARGVHPIGTGVGAALGGAAAGALAGSVGGPVGTLVGAVFGAIVGALAGKSVAETIDSTRALAHWRDNNGHRPYADDVTAVDEYEAPFGYGVSAYTKYPDPGLDEVDADLSRVRKASRRLRTLAWDRARLASRELRYRVGSWR
jgi:hypothetical protein